MPAAPLQDAPGACVSEGFACAGSGRPCLGTALGAFQKRAAIGGSGRNPECGGTKKTWRWGGPLAELSADMLAQEVKNAEEDVADAGDDNGKRQRAQERLDHLR